MLTTCTSQSLIEGADDGCIVILVLVEKTLLAGSLVLMPSMIGFTLYYNRIENVLSSLHPNSFIFWYSDTIYRVSITLESA